jgi:uncharacterized protein (TIGR03905 family)
MTIQYKPIGVCAQAMTLDIENNKIISVKIKGGCSGNSSGIANLLTGMDIQDAIKRLEGVRCGMKASSCPDQIARALKSIQQ